MPKVSIYLPDDLYREAQEHGLAVSALTQQAIEAALRRRHNRDWIERLGQHPLRLKQGYDTIALMDQVREEFGR